MFVYRRPVDSRCELRRTDHGSLCGMNSIFIFCRFGGCMISEVNVRWNMRRFSDLKLSRWWGSPWERSIRFPNSCWASCWSRTAILYPEGCRWGQEIWFGRWHHTCRHRKRCRPSKIEECEVYELRWTDGIVVHYWVKPLNSHISDLKCVGGQENREAPVFFPKDVSSQGSSEDCWRISHHTYPTHISHHTYPTHIHHTTHIPHISIQNVSHQYVSMQRVCIQNVCISRFAIRIPPIRIRSTRIPPVRFHAMRIHSKGVHQQESQTYRTNTYPTNTYLQHVSHQYGSIQKVCISRNGNEYEYHCISFHTIATRREW